MDSEPIPQSNLISPEKSNNFGNNPLDCALNALVYGLRTYIEKIRNEESIDSNAGYVYHSLPLNILNPEHDKQNKEDKPTKIPQKNPSFIALLREIFSAYPELSKTQPSRYLKPRKICSQEQLFLENEGKFIILNQKLQYDKVSAVWNGLGLNNNDSKKQARNDKPEEPQIKISLQDLDQESEKKVNASISAIQTALQIEKGNPEKILRNKQTAMEAINSLPYKTQLTIAFEFRLNDGTFKQLGFVNFLVYPPNPDNPANDPNKKKDRIVIKVFMNDEEANKEKMNKNVNEQKKPRFKKIIEISPEEHGIDPQEFESFLNKLYKELLYK